MEERVHPIPFRTRQLSSPSSMILRTLTWESRTTPRLYFQRAVLSRTALCFARTHPHHGPPLPKPQARRKPLLLFLPLTPHPRVSSPQLFFLRYPPGSLHNRLICFLSTFFSHSLKQRPGKPLGKAERCPHRDAWLSCRFHEERTGKG